jgi:transposase
MEGQEVVTSSLETTREETMVNQDQWGAIKALREQGLGKKKIARILGIDVKTVRRHLRKGGWIPYQRPSRPGLLDRFRDYLGKRMPQVDYCAQVLFQEIRDQGYEGSYNRVKEYVRPFREEQVRLAEATVRFETAPGKQAQVDWGTTAVSVAGRSTRISVFVMVLGYCRRVFAVATTDQKVGTLIRCHHEAFDHFGGRTQDILYDNPKTICLKREEDRPVLNPVFEDFARYWGFRVKLCHPYRARTKGKVESGVKYVKKNFLKGKSFESIAHLNRELVRWCLTIADERIHGTTHRKPSEMFQEEILISTAGQPPYIVNEPLRRMVASDCLVSYQTNRYSVPHRHVGRMAELVVTAERLKVFIAGELVADHALSHLKFQRVLIPGHYAGIGQVPRREISQPAFVPAAWPEVEVRSLDVYEVLTGGGR